MSFHFSDDQTEKAIKQMLDAVRVGAAADPSRAIVSRAMEAIFPELMRFQVRERNRGTVTSDITCAIMEVFGWQISNSARQNPSATREQSEIAVLALIKVVLAEAMGRLDGRMITSVKGERGGHS